MAGGYGSKYLNGKINRTLKFIYPPLPILNIIPRKVYVEISKHLFHSSFDVLNIGSGDKTALGSGLWKYSKGNVTNLDIMEGPNVDIVADAHDLPFGNHEFDTIVMQAVLEHLHSPKRAIEEAFRVLKPGGYIYLEVPFLQGFHADPHDYYRFTQVGLDKLVCKYGKVELVGVSSGPFSALNWIFRDLVSNITKYQKINLVIRFFYSWLFFPLKFLDLMVKNSKASTRLACEYYYLVRKF